MHLAFWTLTQIVRNHSPLCLPHDELSVVLEVLVVPVAEVVLVGGLALGFQSSGSPVSFFCS